MHDRADNPPDGEAPDDVDRQVRADIDASDAHCRNEQPRRPSTGPTEIGAGDGGERSRHRHMRRRERQTRRDGPMQQHPGDAFVRRSLARNLRESLRHDPRRASTYH